MPASRFSSLRANTQNVSSPGFGESMAFTGLPDSATMRRFNELLPPILPKFFLLAARKPEAYNLFNGESLTGRSFAWVCTWYARSMKSSQQITVTERALLVGVAWKRSPRFPGQLAGVPERESLAELVELARSAGAEIDRKSTRLNY